MNAAGRVRLLTAGSDDHPSFSPDGQRIVFDRAGEIWVMNRNGSGQTNLSNTGGLLNSNFDDSNPSFSPDGQRIVFERDDTDPNTFDTTFEIWVMNANGSAQARVGSLDRRGPRLLAGWSEDRLPELRLARDRHHEHGRVRRPARRRRRGLRARLAAGVRRRREREQVQQEEKEAQEACRHGQEAEAQEARLQEERRRSKPQVPGMRSRAIPEPVSYLRFTRRRVTSCLQCRGLPLG